MKKRRKLLGIMHDFMIPAEFEPNNYDIEALFEKAIGTHGILPENTRIVISPVFFEDLGEGKGLPFQRIKVEFEYSCFTKDGEFKGLDKFLKERGVEELYQTEIQPLNFMD